MLEQFSLCAEFLRCRDVEQLVRTCKDVDDIQVLSMKTTMAAEAAERSASFRLFLSSFERTLRTAAGLSMIGSETSSVIK